MPTQHFIIEGRYLGSCERSTIWRGPLQQPPQSFVFVCPVCGESWAKAMIEDSLAFIFTKPCHRHTAPACRITGSVWLPLEPEFTSSLPPAVVEWEFERHLDYLEKIDD